MTGRKKSKSATQLTTKQRQALEERLAKLERLQAVYHKRGHDVTPVDKQIEAVENQLNNGGQSELLED